MKQLRTLIVFAATTLALGVAPRGVQAKLILTWAEADSIEHLAYDTCTVATFSGRIIAILSDDFTHIPGLTRPRDTVETMVIFGALAGTREVYLGRKDSLDAGGFDFAVGNHIALVGSVVEFNGRYIILPARIARGDHLMVFRNDAGDPLPIRRESVPRY